MVVLRLLCLALALALSLPATLALAQGAPEPPPGPPPEPPGVVAPLPKTPEPTPPAAPAATVPAATTNDPVGSYTVVGGSIADESDYVGVVSVVRTGASYTVIWTIDNETVTGVGLLSGEVLAVGFPDDNKDAVALYRRQPDGSWVGQWAAVGDTVLNPEVWKPKP